MDKQFISDQLSIGMFQHNTILIYYKKLDDVFVWIISKYVVKPYVCGLVTDQSFQKTSPTLAGLLAQIPNIRDLELLIEFPGEGIYKLCNLTDEDLVTLALSHS